MFSLYSTHMQHLKVANIWSRAVFAFLKQSLPESFLFKFILILKELCCKFVTFKYLRESDYGLFRLADYLYLFGSY